MADYVLEREKVFERENEQSAEKKTSRLNIFFLVLAFSLIFLLLTAIIFYYFIFLPNTSIAKIKITGNTVLSELFLKDKANLSNSLKWNKIDSMQVAKSIANISSVESVSVQKKLPDKVLIKITERVAVAISFIQIEGRTVPILIDKKGVLFVCDTIDVENLPIISGLEFNNFSEGMRLNFGLKSLLNNISILQNEAPNLLNQISEIKVLAKKYGGYELILFPIASKVRVKIKDNLTAETLKHALLVIDIVNGLDDLAYVDEIDLRSGVAVIEKDAVL